MGYTFLFEYIEPQATVACGMMERIWIYLLTTDENRQPFPLLIGTVSISNEDKAVKKERKYLVDIASDLVVKTHWNFCRILHPAKKPLKGASFTAETTAD